MENQTTLSEQNFNQEQVPVDSAQDLMPNLTPDFPMEKRKNPWIIVILIILGAVIGVFAYKYYQISQKAAPSSTNVEPTITSNPLPDDSTVEPTQVLETDTQPEVEMAEPTLLPSISDSSEDENNFPAAWQRKEFESIGLSIAYPKTWQSSLESFPSNNETLLKFWQGSTSDTATIQLKVTQDNSGSSIYGEGFIVSEKLGITAQKSDPPKMDEKKLDRYLTLYGFDYQYKYYVMSCVHNWIPEIYTQCEEMLRSLKWTE